MDREFASGGAVFKKSNVNPFDKLRIDAEQSRSIKNQMSNVLWLVTKSAPSDLYPESYWRLPKGWLDDEDSGKKPGPLGRGERRVTEKDLKKAALREIGEEGGVKAKIVKKLGTEKIFFTSKIEGKKILKFVTFYLMEWTSDLPDGFGFETSEIAWLPYDEARKKLKHSGEKKVLDKAKEALERGIQGNLI